MQLRVAHNAAITGIMFCCLFYAYNGRSPCIKQTAEQNVRFIALLAPEF